MLNTAKSISAFSPHDRSYPLKITSLWWSEETPFFLPDFRDPGKISTGFVLSFEAPGISVSVSEGGGNIFLSHFYLVAVANKCPLSQGYGFSSSRYGCESWTRKKTERRRMNAFEPWCWRLLRVPWTAKRSNQSILKEISPGCWNSNTLATWCEQLTHLKRPWCWERLRAGGEGDDRGWDGWMASLTQWTWVWVNSGSWWGTGRPGCGS